MRFRRGPRALDVGCGAGRVSLFLQEKGFRVTSIDNSPLAIKLCRKRGVTDARLFAFENVSRFPASTFDTVVMFGNNFGLAGNRIRAKRLFKQLHRITTAGAVVLAESLNPYDTKNRAHLKYQRLNRRRGRMSGQIRIRIRFEACYGPWFDYLLVSSDEMGKILKGTGWQIRQLIQDASRSYVAVIEKIVAQ